jgi:hypothetical protein
MVAMQLIWCTEKLPLHVHYLQRWQKPMLTPFVAGRDPKKERSEQKRMMEH